MKLVEVSSHEIYSSVDLGGSGIPDRDLVSFLPHALAQKWVTPTTFDAAARCRDRAACGRVTTCCSTCSSYSG